MFVAAFEVDAVRSEVNRLPCDAGFHGRLRNGVTDLHEEAAVERLRDYVARAELKRLVRIERLDLVGDGLARQAVPDDVKALYPGETLEFGPEYIIPKPFDRRLFVEVSFAVAEAAVKSGVARAKVDLSAYRLDLERRNEARQANT